MFVYQFRNDQRCILATIVAKSSRSAWAKFRRNWMTHGVTIEFCGAAA